MCEARWNTRTLRKQTSQQRACLHGPDQEYLGRTVYDPGSTYPMPVEWTNKDHLAMMGHTLPPEEYDHPYPGRLTVIVTNTLEETRNLCLTAHVPDLISCAVISDLPRSCTIIHPSASELEKHHSTVNVTMRHEIGHCNGWPGDHKGAR
jgi:hypothetical protein